MKCLQIPDDPPLVFWKKLDKGGSSGMNTPDMIIDMSNVSVASLEMKCDKLTHLIKWKSLKTSIATL